MLLHSFFGRGCQKKKIKIFLIVILVSIVVFIIGVLSKNMYFYKIFTWILATLTGEESSSAARTSIWIEAFQKMLNNPFGIGFGKVGSFAYGIGTVNVLSCENSYIAIALDLGWMGFWAYFLFLISLIVRFSHIKENNIDDQKIKRSGIAMIIYLMICFFFSNHIYDMEAMTIIFFIVGLQLKLFEAQKRQL